MSPSDELENEFNARRRRLAHHDSNSQPAPTGHGQPVAVEVVKDILLRREQGKKKYGRELKTDNGRIALVDLYQELLDATMYIKQELMQREAAVPNIVNEFETSELKALCTIVAVARIDDHPRALTLYGKLQQLIRDRESE